MIEERLKAIILRELHLKDFTFNDDTKAFQVPGWDSLSHMRIITAVEGEYGIRLRNVEIIKLKSVGDLQILIDSKISKGNS
jgi:acyl carrier protein